MRKGQGRSNGLGEGGNDLDNISPVHHLTSFCDHLIGSVKFSCAHRKDIDKLEHKMTALQVNSNERH